MLDHFHQFPNLPMELRLKIWKFHLRIPREVKITEKRACRLKKPGETDPPRYVCGRFHGGTQPVLLSVNQESRRESQNHFKRYFTQRPCLRYGNCLWGPKHDARSHDGIYLNPAYDSIRGNMWDLEDCFSWPDIQYFKRIAVTDFCTLTKQRKVVLPIAWFDLDWNYGQLGYPIHPGWGQPSPCKITSMKIIMPTISNDPDVQFNGTTIFIPKHRHSRPDEVSSPEFPEITVVREETGPIVAFRPCCIGEDLRGHWQLTGMKIHEEEEGNFGFVEE